MLSEEQTKEIKEQLINQINENFPEDKKQLAIEQINSMNSEELEDFLKQNQMQESQGEKCIFCSIVSRNVRSYKIGENEKAVAVLEINPISEAHSLIIPKEHSESVDSPAIKSLAGEISEKIKAKFKPKRINMFISELFNHKVINILPIYKTETAGSKRKKEVPEELEEIQKILEEASKEIPDKKIRKKIEKSKEINEESDIKEKEKFSLPKRIP